MQYRRLGKSGLQVSPICLGTMTFGEPVAQPEAIELVHAAIDKGINFIDTANNYEGYSRFLGSPGGVAEEITGRALKGRRGSVVLATKVCAPVGPGPQDRGLSATHILRELDRSLKRLQTDYIDLYIMHWPDVHTPLETSLDAMQRAVQAGKVRYVGASNHNAAQLCEMLWQSDRSHHIPVVSSQIPYSLLRREFHNDLQFCEKHQIAVTPYQSLQGGMLTGKYRRGQQPPHGSRLAEKPDWIWPPNDSLFNQLETIEVIASDINASVAQYSLAWTLTQPAMTSLVVGAKRIDQVQDAVAAVELTIPDEHQNRIDAVCPPPWRQPDPIRG